MFVFDFVFVLAFMFLITFVFVLPVYFLLRLCLPLCLCLSSPLHLTLPLCFSLLLCLSCPWISYYICVCLFICVCPCLCICIAMVLGRPWWLTVFIFSRFADNWKIAKIYVFISRVQFKNQKYQKQQHIIQSYINRFKQDALMLDQLFGFILLFFFLVRL